MRTFPKDPIKCVHSAQIGFDEQGNVICQDCGRQLGWVQASQLREVYEVWRVLGEPDSE